MGAYEYICPACGQISFYLTDFLGGAEPAYIIHLARQIFQTGLECIEMLEGEYRRRHKHGHLLSVADSLESGPYGNFCFSEADISAHQTVHRAGIFHILLHHLCGEFLVGGIFIHEGRFQFVLQIGIRRKSETFGGTALRIKLDKFLRYILYLPFGVGLERSPCLASQFVDFRRFAVGGAETGYFVEGMYGYENHVAVAIIDFHDFPGLAVVVVHFNKTAEYAYAMVDVNYIVANVEGIQFVNRKLLCFFHAAAHGNTVETVENLMVGVETLSRIGVYESAVDILTLYEIRDDTYFRGNGGTEPFYLRILFAEYAYMESLFRLFPDVRGEQFVVLVEDGLRGNLEVYGFHPTPFQRYFQINLPVSVK